MEFTFERGRSFAESRDSSSTVGTAAEYDVPGHIYFDSNSLGPISERAHAAVESVLQEWRELGVRGWSDADPPWFYYGEILGDRIAPIVGAREREVVVANSTTINIHTVLGSFLDRCLREDRGHRVLVNELDFPTDHYAIRGQLRMRGLNPDDSLVAVESRDGLTIRPEDIEAALEDDPEIGIVFMPSVLYQSGQRFDIERISRLAHDHEAFVGFDLAHSVGLVPHSLKSHDVDFAVWCTYKYLNAGPGSIAGLYVDETYYDELPSLPGWWGHEKETQFEMRMEFTPADSAGAWQIGTIPVLSAAPLFGVLDIVEERGIDRIHERSMELTAYLIYQADQKLPECEIGTPRSEEDRGGHVAIRHEEAHRISEALIDEGVIVDYRPPDIVRMCPSPYHSTFQEVFDAIEILRDIIQNRRYEEYEITTGGVT